MALQVKKIVHTFPISTLAPKTPLFVDQNVDDTSQPVNESNLITPPVFVSAPSSTLEMKKTNIPQKEIHSDIDIIPYVAAAGVVGLIFMSR